MSKNIFKKIIIPLLIFGALISGLGARTSYAFHDGTIHEPIAGQDEAEYLKFLRSQTNQQQPGQTAKNVKTLLGQLAGSCAEVSSFFIFNLGCATKMIGYLLYSVFYVTGWLLAAVANVFNYVLGITFDNANYSDIGVIREGWAFSRDVVNLFFIFILLFIAIATILQIESYGAKKLLVWLVLVALLVNFSLLAARFIIYATNSLGILFYQSISANESPFLSSLKIGKEGFRKDISGAFMAGLDQQQIMAAPVTQANSPAPPADPENINLVVIVILLTGIILFTLAMIVFAAGAFFMVVRLAMLWILMILAPFGFVFLILPITRSYALQWWRTLQSQALFAPAFMFFIIITVKVGQSDLVRQLSQRRLAGAISTTEFLILLIIQSVILIILLGASLIVAKQMGIYGANAVMGTAKSFGKFVGGYAGRGALRAGAPVARYIEKGGERIGRLPLVGAAWRMATKPLAAVSRGEEKLKAERENYYKGLAPKAFASTYRSVVDPFERKLALRAGAEAGKLGELSEAEIQTAYNQNADNPKALNNILKIRPDLIARDTTRYSTPAARLDKTREILSKMSEKDIEEKLEKAALANPVVQEAMILAMGEREMAALIRRHGDDATKAIQEGVDIIGPTGIAPVFDQLYKNNRNLLRGVFRNPALSIQLKTLKGDIEREVKARTPPYTTTPQWADEKEFMKELGI